MSYKSTWEIGQNQRWFMQWFYLGLYETSYRFILVYIGQAINPSIGGQWSPSHNLNLGQLVYISLSVDNKILQHWIILRMSGETNQ